jgi:hypothetical protein
MNTRAVATIVAAALSLPAPAAAVFLNPEGTGQALLFPYYTTLAVNGNAFNTYLSIVNHAADAKALRVRFREGRNGVSVGEFNLYLAPNDVWTGAVVPMADDRARVLTADRSCTDPRMAPIFGGVPPPGDLPGLSFSNALYLGTSAMPDTSGLGLDRTREGFFEVLEMATLRGESAASITPGDNGLPRNCDSLRGAATADIAAPSGGLAGTLTVINVANGMDFTLNAEALAELAARPYYRAISDPYPAFTADEIEPVSLVEADGFIYRSQWSRGVDAVSATFMRRALLGEYTLDRNTRSQTDFVVTFPTRHFYATPQSAAPPFAAPLGWKRMCGLPTMSNLADRLPGELLAVTYFNREIRGATIVPPDSSVPVSTYDAPRACASSTILSPLNGPSATPEADIRSKALGSANFVPLLLPSTFDHGWLRINAAFADSARLQSLPTSTRLDPATGASVPGAHRFAGYPMTGFSVRTFENGTLTCGSASCQGNYGGAFPLHAAREITR